MKKLSVVLALLATMFLLPTFASAQGRGAHQSFGQGGSVGRGPVATHGFQTHGTVGGNLGYRAPIGGNLGYRAPIGGNLGYRAPIGGNFVRGYYGPNYRGAWLGLPFAYGFGYRGWYGPYNGVWGFYGPGYIPGYSGYAITVYEQVQQTVFDPQTGQYVYTGATMTVAHVAVWNSYYGGYVYTDSYGRLQVVG